MELSYGILAVTVAVSAAVLFVALPRVGTPGPLTLFLRYAAAAGVAGVGSSAMYLISGAGGGIVPLVLGDVAMVFAPALLLVALRALDGERVEPWASASVALAAVTAIATSSLPQPPSLVVKVLLLALASGACVVTAACSRADASASMRLIIAATALYAGYSVARVVVGLTAGWESGLYRSGFSFAPATIVSAVVIVVMGVAVVRVRIGPRTLDALPAVCPPGRAVVVGDWTLASAAYGPERMRELVAELRAAGRGFDDEAREVPRGVEVAVPDAIAKLGDRLRDTHGWSPDEVALLVDGSTDDTVPPFSRRRNRWPRRGSARS